LLKINDELKKLIPPLQPEEYSLLQESIIKDGCRDALILWEDTLIDGHNRYEICQNNDVPFDTIDMHFDNILDVQEWMINNQFSRRNLPLYERARLALKLKPIVAAKAKENLKIYGGNQYAPLENSPNIQKPIDTRVEIAKTAGVSDNTIARVEKIEEKAPEKVKAQLRNGEISINQAYQQVRRIEKIEKIEEKIVPKTVESKSIDIYNTDKKYNIIYADPAWGYFEGGNKNQSLHYNTMTIEDICKLPIKDIADDNCILFIWVTFPILQESFKVIESWGFNYSTCGFNWIKKNKISGTNFFGCGSWTRANSELCLIATKGSILRLDATISQVIETPIEEHSKKPEITRTLITKLVGELPRIELFSRNDTDGWDVWGDMI